MRSKSIGLALYLQVNLPFLLCFTLYLRAIFQVRTPGGAYIWRGDLTEGFLRYRFGGLIFGAAYFRNFTVTARRFHWFPREMTFEKTRSRNRSSVWNFCAPSSDILSWGNQLKYRDMSAVFSGKVSWGPGITIWGSQFTGPARLYYVIVKFIFVPFCAKMSTINN